MTDAFARRLLNWFDEHGRHDLPWQHEPTPYRVWVSEIMLQQTQVATVIDYYTGFMDKFPDIHALARAPVDDVLHLWSGLGYYARARNLHKSAGIIVDEHAGVFPATLDGCVALPGIGESTAAAILALAHGQHHAILDGNVKRVLSRFHGVYGQPGTSATVKELWVHARAHTPAERVAHYTQAIMDLGATLCTRSKPRCADCPQHSDCHAYAQGAQAELPARKRRKDKPTRAARLLIVRDAAGSVLLQQRPASGIWGGLYSLPELGDDDARDWCERNALGPVTDERVWPVLRHTFSHFHLDITPICVELAGSGGDRVEDAGWVWYNRNAPAAVGLAAPIEKLLSGNQHDQNG